MATVETMQGPVDTGRLGVTLMHEHIFVLSPEILVNYPEVCGDEDRRVEDAVARLNDLYDSGVQSVVDLS
jgi:phosphotriesterase-related protein